MLCCVLICLNNCFTIFARFLLLSWAYSACGHCFEGLETVSKIHFSNRITLSEFAKRLFHYQSDLDPLSQTPVSFFEMASGNN